MPEGMNCTWYRIFDTKNEQKTEKLLWIPLLTKRRYYFSEIVQIVSPVIFPSRLWFCLCLKELLEHFAQKHFHLVRS